MIRKYGMYAVWVIALIGSCTTLYLTEVQYWQPCQLCWYQQVCMLPLIFLAGMAAWYGFHGMARYLLPQTLIGLCLALIQIGYGIYHPTPLKSPPIEICKPGYIEIVSIDCNLNLPILSAIAFFLINILLIIIQRMSKKEDAHATR